MSSDTSETISFVNSVYFYHERRRFGYCGGRKWTWQKDTNQIHSDHSDYVIHFRPGVFKCYHRNLSIPSGGEFVDSFDQIGYKRYCATWSSIGYDFQLYPKWGEVELQHKYQILVAVNPIASFISAPLGGYLSSKLGRARPLLVAALVVLVASNILYSTVSVTTQQYRYPLLLVARIATGISSGKS